MTTSEESDHGDGRLDRLSTLFRSHHRQLVRRVVTGDERSDEILVARAR